MHGNVWEWVRDWYGDYPDVLAVEPDGPRSGDGRVIRGGSFFYSPQNLRSANRADDDPERRYVINRGFRCARVSPPQH
jgi:formylglycine-generating enzyme required for sulfatase activity